MKGSVVGDAGGTSWWTHNFRRTGDGKGIPLAYPWEENGEATERKLDTLGHCYRTCGGFASPASSLFDL